MNWSRLQVVGVNYQYQLTVIKTKSLVPTLWYNLILKTICTWYTEYTFMYILRLRLISPLEDRSTILSNNNTYRIMHCRPSVNKRYLIYNYSSISFPSDAYTIRSGNSRQAFSLGVSVIYLSFGAAYYSWHENPSFTHTQKCPLCLWSDLFATQSTGIKYKSTYRTAT